MRCSDFIRRNVKLPAIALGLAAFAAPAAAATITVDGNLSDWGITVADNNGSDFTNLATNIGLQASFVEDQNDNAGDGGYVGPNYGGQNYDGEFLGMAMQGTNLYIAIVTGQRPDNGSTKFGPGDIRLTIDGTDYGIEVGGGYGGSGNPGTPVTTGDAGTTYTLNSNGYTTGTSTTAAAQTAGSVWVGANWINDPIAPQTPVQMSIAGTSASQVGTADYVYTSNSVTSQHAIMELALDVSSLINPAGGSQIGVHWSPSCGNDVVDAVFTASNETVPEPASSLIWLAGFGAVAGMRYRRKRRNA